METKLQVKLNNLFFDPNNYRLRTHQNYKPVDKNSEIKPSIQKRTYNLVSGNNEIEIFDLIESIKSNGFLKVDHILVRKHKNTNNYVVIEGNRRLAALKYLESQNTAGYDIGKLNPSIFKVGVEVVKYNYSKDLDYLVLMGLRHVSGNKKWETYNQAKLLYELKQKGFESSEIAKRIGLYKAEVDRLIKGYYAIEDFIKEVKEENLGKEFSPHEKFMIFVELTNKPNLRNWIGWDETNYKITNEVNKKRFFSWVKPQLEFSIEDEDRAQILDPIIKNHKQVRQLDNLIFDEDFLESMVERGDFESALNESESYAKAKFSRSIKEIEKAFNKFSIGYIQNLTTSDKKSLNNIRSVIDTFLGKSK